MLVRSQRLTVDDLALWASYESGDKANVGIFASKLSVSVDAVREFASRGPCYCGVSWGKDSVVVAYLCRLVDTSIPLIHLRPSNHNPDCDAVRDAYFDKFPGQRYEEIRIDYGTLHSKAVARHLLDKETDKLWYEAIRELNRRFENRYILGIRSQESTGRRIRELVHGESSKTGCAPITRWKTAEVFAFLAACGLPVHPAYAMMGGGRWPRERLRVAEIGDVHGSGGGRTAWETEYYGDVLRRVFAGK